MAGATKLSDLGCHDFTGHLMDRPVEEITENFCGLGYGNLPERFQRTNFVNDRLPVVYRRLNWKIVTG
jgi:hypothetical protein